MVNKTPLLHQSFGPRVFSLSPSLSLSFFFRLILWSAEALCVHFPAQASKTLLRRCSVASPHREGTWGLLGFLCKPRNISLFLSPLLFYHRLWTTRFWSIKEPQHWCTHDTIKQIGVLSKLPKVIHESTSSWSKEEWIKF